LIIRRKVNEIKAQTSIPQRQIDLALSWVTQYVRPQDASPSPVISDDYYNILKRGAGFCDQAAHVFAVLSTRLGIPARMIMLRDRDGISRHTAAEVFLDNKWQYIDPWLGVFPHKADRTGFTRFEFAHDQSALVKYGYAPGLTGYDFSHSLVFETFPFMSFGNLIKKALSKFSNLHETSDPGGVSNVSQNHKSSLFEKLTEPQIEILKLYDRARSKHLEGNFSDAREIYSKLLNNKELAMIAEASKFFLGVTYFDQHDFVASEKYFKHEITSHPKNPWINSEYRFLGESLIAQENIAEAKTWLQKATSQGAQARLRKLDQSISDGLKAPFISY